MAVVKAQRRTFRKDSAGLLLEALTVELSELVLKIHCWMLLVLSAPMQSNQLVAGFRKPHYDLLSAQKPTTRHLLPVASYCPHRQHSRQVSSQMKLSVCFHLKRRPFTGLSIA